jgi:hypothetical protein
MFVVVRALPSLGRGARGQGHMGYIRTYTTSRGSLLTSNTFSAVKCSAPVSRTYVCGPGRMVRKNRGVGFLPLRLLRDSLHQYFIYQVMSNRAVRWEFRVTDLKIAVDRLFICPAAPCLNSPLPSPASPL